MSGNGNPRIRRESAHALAGRAVRLLLLSTGENDPETGEEITRKLLLVRADVVPVAFARELSKLMDQHEIPHPARPLGVIQLRPEDELEALDLSDLAMRGLRPAGLFVCTTCGAEIPASPMCADCLGIEVGGAVGQDGETNP